ncbi:transporter substrate-binding domain-containing protein [Pelomonas sp. SE-A7]|uniref:substrate-binding periplasmic protein n=1 Tax=Pelomonas sp. SE-A7 TaxID=3054953 RepID=UPI00259C8110|nr:transporter substrate-binding domain-containing protein [Pelomonas sp. SE-A7]MDM4768386.1 transporter substrate-binding domain-containing protein [Pelomonas sp. SE-A7]
MSLLVRRRSLLIALPLLPASARQARAGAPPVALQAFAHPLPPLAFEQEGQVSGLATELLREMARRAGLPLAIALQPRLRAEKSFAEQTHSLLYPLARLPEREGRFRWIGPILPRRVQIYRLAERTDIRFQGLRQLNGLTVGAMTGSATMEQLLQLGLGPGKELDLATSYEVCMRKLLAGRTDLVVMGDLNAYWQLRQQGEASARIVAVGELDQPPADYAFGLRPDASDALQQQLQTQLDALRRSGHVEQLKQRFGLPA